ncbi:MAG TPA: MFS transporter [Xanthobacteraceae bacterium]|nr:MFS transporter [Xanthobacteraceae bacterium]
MIPEGINSRGVKNASTTRPPTPPLARQFAPRLPFYYGWIVLACLCCAGFARQGPAVATLSIFIEPLTREFGWSRAALSGAVSLGGLLAALVAPLLGPMLDRRGSRLILSLAVTANGAALLLLSLTPSLSIFYVLFSFARMSWAGPFDLGIYGALNNWFIARRRSAASIVTLAHMAGLMAMPLIAQLAISQSGWRGGWIALGMVTLAVGFIPVWLFLVRRPEDLGLVPDRSAPSQQDAHTQTVAEPRFSRREAIRTPAFWLLMLYTAAVYPVQAGVSLHQAPHLLQRGLDPTTAALIVSSFSLMSGLGTIACGFLPRRWSIRFPLAVAGVLLAVGTLLMPGIEAAYHGYLAVGLFGLGIGGVLTLTPVAWADYFGRESYGAIRGMALSTQVVAQAAGPLLAGALYDLTGSYQLPLQVFAALSVLAIAAALAAKQPRSPFEPRQA